MISFLINNFRLGFGHVTLKNLDFLKLTLTIVLWTELHFCVNRLISAACPGVSQVLTPTSGTSIQRQLQVLQSFP